MNLKFIVICGILFIGLSRIHAQQDANYYFYSVEDIQTIRQSSETEWGRAIIDRFKQVVEKRELYSKVIPVLEGGHGHHYFCPIHNTQFVFDWNSPHAHLCMLCNKKWSGADRYDWAWVNTVHAENLKYLTANMYLFLATDQQRYAQNIKDILLDLAGKYPQYIEHDRERRITKAYSGKMFAQSLDEAVWAVDAARAYMVAASVMTEDEKASIQEGYLRPCAALLMNRSDKGNWQVWHNGGIIALGVALKNDSIIHVALDKPALGYYAMMQKNVYADGWWNEGSVVYHFYPLRAILLSAEALRCRQVNLYDDKLVNMFMSPVNMLYPDLTFPSQNDGWYGINLLEQCNLYEIMALRTKLPQFIQLLYLCYKQVKRGSPESLMNGMNFSETQRELTLKSHLFPDLGVGILRSVEKMVVMKCGPHGGLHGHPDKLSISIHDGKKEILPDLGTTAYGVPDCYDWYRKTISHNTVTVDGKDQQICSGKITRFEPWDNGGVIEANVDNAYKGVQMQRLLMLKDNGLVDKLTCKSDTTHTYDYVFILRQPAFTDGIPDSLPGYGRISKVIKRKQNTNTFSFVTVNDVKVTIRANAVKSMDLYSGVAPGIPPTGTQKGEDVYPLLIRVKGRNLNVETKWDFTK